MEVPHDESTSFGIEAEYDGDWAPKPKRAAKPGEGHESDAKLDKNHEHVSGMQGSLETRIRDEIVGILKWLKDETSADLSALEKDRAEAQPLPARPPPWRDKNAGQTAA